MSPLISIITLNYNQADITCEFLQSLYSLTYPNFEVIVVDNDSDESPRKKVEACYPEATYIQSTANLGYAGGNNLGIQKAKGEYFFIVNNDTEVTPDLLNILIRPLLADEKIGMISPKIKYYDSPEYIQYAGFTNINPFTGRNKTIGEKEKDHGQYDEVYPTSYCHGAAVLARRVAVEKTGMIPEVFFLCYEELDWSEQMKRAGYDIYYEGRATIFHKESISIGKESALKTYFHLRNRILFMRRNHQGFSLIIFYAFLITFALPKSLIAYTIKREKQHTKSLLKAIRWHLSKNRNLYDPSPKNTVAFS